MIILGLILTAFKLSVIFKAARAVLAVALNQTTIGKFSLPNP
jgi:hypothetical protein